MTALCEVLKPDEAYLERESMTTRNLVIGAATACFLVGAFALGGAFDDPGTDMEKPEPRATPVAIQWLEKQTSYEVERYFTGRVVARRTSELGFERAGKITAVIVDEGQKVPEGAAIAHLDTALLEAQLTFAREALAAESAQLDELAAGPRPFETEQARALVSERQAELSEVMSRHARVTQLLGRNATTRSEFDEVVQQRDAAQARVTSAKQALAGLDAGTREERLARQAAVVAQQEARVAELRLEIEKSTLLAPYDAIVSVRRLDEGSVVNPGAAVVRLVEVTAAEARIGVPLELARRFEVGEQVPVQIGTRRESAEVLALLPELDPTTRTRPLLVRLSSAAVPGDVVRLTVREAVAADGFWIPISALARAPHGLWSCYAVEDEKIPRVSRRAIEVIFTDGDRAFVRGTLQDGDRIVRSGTDRVVVGQRVVVAKKD